MLTDISKLKSLGANVTIYEFAKIVNTHVVEVGEGTQIDDFTFINGGLGIVLGKFNHIASFVSIIGGGELVTEDYAGISCGSRIVTGTQGYGDGKRMSPLIPEDQQQIIRGRVVLKKDSFLGSNVVVHPNITIGEGAIIGSGAVVVRDVEPWTINVGVPARVVGERPRVRV